MTANILLTGVNLAPFTTLKTGGKAEQFLFATDENCFIEHLQIADENETTVTVLGKGSNVLPSDAGIPGLTIINSCKKFILNSDGVLECSTGLSFQDLFLRTTQAGFGSFEYAVGIPGSIGGALVSNAGAYRSNISEFLTHVKIIKNGKLSWEEASIMQFSYRDSVLRQSTPPPFIVVAVRFQLSKKPLADSFNEAREYQRQRISKQPAPASAGSFFKNVNDHKLALSLDHLPEKMKQSGVVPAGYLLEECGLKGIRHGGAMISPRHANFILNVGNANATQIRELADIVRDRVHKKFQVVLEEEVLYIGDWSNYS